jgi:polyisoprenoid-binding protein YceI
MDAGRWSPAGDGIGRMTRKSRWVIGIAATVAVLIAGAGVAAWFVFGGNEPPPAALTTLPTSTSPSASSNDPAGGTWTIDATSGSLADGSSTYAGYRVEEEVSGFGANTAVGRTQDVSGSMTIEGTTITALEVTVDMTTLQSDRPQRDEQLRERGLETDRFPTATFTLTRPIEVGERPKDGTPVELTAVGDLTLHGVTKPVSVPVQAAIGGDRIQAVASLDVALADYDIEKPTGFLIVSIADTGTIELHLLFEKP